MSYANELLMRLVNAVGDCEDTQAILAIVDDAKSHLNLHPFTPWFPPESKPVHVGAYEVEPKQGYRAFAWWNGREWSIPHFSPEGAMGAAGFDTPHQWRKWRGMRERTN